MHKELYAIAKHYGDDCKDCKEVCCANMALDVNREDQKKMAKVLKMDHTEFRKKYTVLFKSMFKGMEVKNMSPEAKIQFDKNPRLLQFIEMHPKEINLPEEQIKRLTDLGADEKKLRILICPFYDKKTHKCSVHESRPLACYLYPFNYAANSDQIDLRKINACLLSTNSLKRLSKFLERMHLPNKGLEKLLESKEYQNHFYIPTILFYTYILWECEKLKIPLQDPNLKKMRLKLIMETMEK